MKAYYFTFTILPLLILLSPPAVKANGLLSETRIKYNINSSDTKKVKVRRYDTGEIEVEIDSVWLDKKESLYRFKLNETKDFFELPVTFISHADGKALMLKVMGLIFDISGKNIEAKVGFSGNEKMTIKINDNNTDSLFVYCYVTGESKYKEIRAVKRKKEFFSLREEEIDLLSDNLDSVVKFFFLKDGKIYQTKKKEIFNTYPAISSMPLPANCDDIIDVKEKTWSMRIEYFDFLLKCQEGEKRKKKKKGFSFFGLF